MSKFTGNIIRLPAVTPTQNSASGVYTLDDQFTAQSSGTWPIVRDQYFNYTTLLLTGAVQGTAYPNPVTQPYSFLSDASTNNFVVSPNGDVSARPFNPYLNNYSNYFSGSGQYLSSASNAAFGMGSGDYTIECWVYITATSTYDGIYSTTGTTSSDIQVQLNNRLLRVSSYTAQTVIANAGTEVSLNAWTHVAFCRSGTTLKLFKNGQEVGSGTDSINWAAGAIEVGRVFGSLLLTGYMSNLRVIKGQALYTSAFTPTTSPLTTTSQGATAGNVSLLTCQSNRFIDNSSTPKTITVTGTPAVSQNSPFVSYDTTNGSGYFDGTGDYLSILDNDAFDFGIGDFTISAWVYPTISGGAIIDQGGGGASTNRSFEIFMSNTSTISNAYITSSGSYQSQYNLTGTTTPNAWNFIEFTRSSGTIYLFVNGVQQSSAPANITVYNSTANVFIGETSQSVGNNFGGYISNVRVRKGTGSSSSTVPTAPLQAVTNTSLLTLQTRAPATNNGFIDSSPNNFVVTRNGNTTQGSFSPFSPTGWSNYFNGSASLQTASSSSLTFGTGDFSISFWIYPTVSTAGANTGVMGIGSSVNGTFLIYTKFPGYPDNTIFVAVYGGGSFGSSIPLNVNQWNHVAISRASGTLSIYINGNRGANSSLADNLNGSIASIGKPYYNLSVENYTGYLADIRFVKGTALYSGTSITVPTSPSTLVAGTALLTSQYNRFYDGSGITSSFTIAGSPSVQAFSPFAPAQSYIPSQIGGSGYFDGTTDYLTIANSNDFDTNTPFTLECWVYTGSSGCMFGRGGGAASWSTTDGHQCIFYITGGVLRWQFNSGGSPVTLDSGAIPLNSWVYCVVGYNGTTTRLWLNGVSATTSTSSYTLPTTRNIIRSGLTASGDQPYLGYISGLRFVKSDVYGVANTTIPIPTAPPTAIPNTSLLLNFTNGGIVDATGKNNLETLGNSGVQTSQTKWPPGSIYLSGDGNHLISRSSPVLSLNGDFTMEAWVYPINAGRSADAEKYGTIMSCAAVGVSNPEFSWFIRIVGGVITEYFLNLNFTTVLQVTGLSVSINAWHYFAVTRSGTGTGNLKLYIDGNLVGTSSGAVTQTATFTSAQTLMVGRNAGSTAYQNWLSGYFQGLRITPGYVRNVTSSPTGPFPLG